MFRISFAAFISRHSKFSYQKRKNIPNDTDMYYCWKIIVVDRFSCYRKCEKYMKQDSDKDLPGTLKEQDKISWVSFLHLMQSCLQWQYWHQNVGK